MCGVRARGLVPKTDMTLVPSRLRRQAAVNLDVPRASYASGEGS